MKAAGITLSTVGAGGGSNPFLEGLATAGRRPVLRRREPGQHPGHLPQGDPAGLRPADRRGAVLPDPDVVVADPARRRGRRAAAAARLQRDDGQAGGPDRPRDRRATIRSSRSGSTAWVGRSPGRRTRPGRWARDWLGWSGFSRFFSQLVSWTFPGEETGGIEATLRQRRWPDARCTSRASSRTARRATSTRRRPSWSARISSRPTSSLVQIAPGVYEVAARRDRPRGVCGPRHPDQARGRRRWVGRSGWSPRPPPSTAAWAPNEPFLAAVRTRDRRVGRRDAAGPVAARPDARPAGSRTSGRCCWSWRCCCGRWTSPCGACRSGDASSRRPVAGSAASADGADASRRGPRRAKGCSPPAERATSSATRAAMRAEPEAIEATDLGSGAVATTAAESPAPSPSSTKVAPPVSPPVAPTAPTAAPASSPAPAPAPEPTDTMARLRDAKRRARER